ncbi:BRCA1-associated RING domain protein 1-like isoform X2 [Olea europaea var. sylvestris]|uniref:BRCA1-associated RING domain protein 1-like isoform X2 n=1 Tax=Olea europaea var. sylvestris TaxID=158386 RepID=UPI000C1CE164|nr:BRCA1-associated RING domain protein 1-like isoform X2 [Olea europaea var. sylvestris]
MSEIHNTRNPLALHFQKLGLELKCALWFCTPQLGSECPTCTHLFVDGEMRSVPLLENIITIYKSMDATYNSTISPHLSNDSGKSLNWCWESVTSLDDKTRKKLDEVELQGSDLGSRDGSSGTYRAKRLVEGDFDTAAGEIADRNFHQDPLHTRDAKRQKKQDYGLSKSVGEGLASPSDNTAVSNLNGEPRDAPNIDRIACSFCHSSKQTEWTGPMLYYAKGKQVVGDGAALAKAIPVHSKCLEWTPQIYYVGETAKNLESEVARASKLKCSGCGLKGAALGCFVKSCRKSYHVPCAVEILDCRWDCEDFLMLCPTHSSVKFPREKSRSQEFGSDKMDSSSTKISSNALRFWEMSPTGPKEWFFCGSALSSEDKYLLVKFATMSGATVFKFWNPKVTHVIAATNAEGACSRTSIFLMAIMSGCWILTMDWIKVCMEANHPMNEEPYEVKQDNHGCCDGPKTGRLRALTNAPKLFHGLNFYFTGDHVPTYKNELIDLVTVAGGTVIDSMEQMIAQMQETRTTSTCFFVYNFGSQEGCISETASSPYMQRLAKAQNVAKNQDSQVIPHTWILESIAACRLLPSIC